MSSLSQMIFGLKVERVIFNVKFFISGRNYCLLMKMSLLEIDS